MAVKTINIKNPDISQNELSYLTKRYTGGVQLNVENGEGWANNDVIVVGRPGFEKTEFGFVSSATSLVITLQAAFNFPHDQDQPLYLSKYDQYSLEYQQVSGGVWAAFSDTPKDIEWDDVNSQYITADGTYNAFRWRFYNSKTGEYSAYSPTLPAAGWSRNQGGRMIINVRRLLRDNRGEMATDEEILDALDDGQQHLLTIRKKWWFLKVIPASFTPTVASTSLYGLPAAFDFMEKVLFNYQSGSINEVYRLHYKPESVMDALQADQTQDDNDEGSYWTLRAPDSNNEKGYIDLYPTPSTASQGFKPIYFKKFTTIDSAGDSTECPRPEALEYHAAMMILENNNQTTKADRMENKRDKIIFQLQSQNKRVLDNGEFLQFRGQRGYGKLHGRASRLSRDTLHTNYFSDEYR